MKDEAYFDAYRAYGSVTDFKNYQGLPMPEWEALTDKIRLAWMEAVKSVYRHLDMGGGQLDLLRRNPERDDYDPLVPGSGLKGL